MHAVRLWQHKEGNWGI